MNWKKHFRLKGKHAFLGASKFHWIRYDDNKLRDAWYKSKAVSRGTKMHNVACELIEIRQELPDEELTFNKYVNDAIYFGMKPEQTLYYSENCFGTADAISFKNDMLRIHDLKTGSTPAHMEQLLIYAALFCLEYRKRPSDIDIELRIYQNNEIIIHNPGTDEIVPIMDKIIHFDDEIREMEEEEEELW